MANDKDRGTAGPARRQQASALADFATRRATSRQRRIWSGRVGSWDTHGTAALTSVTAAVVAVANARPGLTVVDLGCGNGQVSIPLARQGADVLAVDVSPAMADSLRAEAKRQGLTALTVIAAPVEELDLPAGSVDLVVSSYALHHLRDADKARLVRTASRWLRPGGRLIIADMMFGRGGSTRDRAIIRSKLTALARKGPGGWWRIIKNIARYLLRVQERPISMQAWTDLLTQAGFAQVTASAIVAEAGLVTGHTPGGPVPEASQASAERIIPT